jgi:hypothetical protein
MLGTSTSSATSSASYPTKMNNSQKVKSRSVPPMMLAASTSIEYEILNKALTASSAPISASSSRSESPMSDRFCGKCSSLVSLHMRTIESDGGLESEVISASTQTRPQAKRKRRDQRQPLSARGCAKKSSRSSLETVETSMPALTTTTGQVDASPRKNSRRLLARSLPGKAETSSSNESLYSGK